MVAAAYDGGWEILEDSLRRLTNGCIIFLKRSTKELLFLMIFGQIGKVENILASLLSKRREQLPNAFE